MKHALPAGWNMVQLGECCDIVSGSTPRRDRAEFWNGEIAWATPRDLSRLDGRVLLDTAERITEEGYKSCPTTLMPPGAVLFTSRAPVGLVAIAGIRVCTNQGFKSLVPGPRVDSGYLYWCLRRYAPRIAARGSGSTFTEVSKKVLSRFEIPVPPLAEQRRIAAILDKADAIRRKRREAIGLLEEFLRSVFLEVFGDPVRNPKGWEVSALGDVIAETQYGTSKKANSDARGLPVLRMNNVTDQGGIDLADLKWCEIPEWDRDKYTVKRGDLLFNRTNSPELVGKTAVWDRDERYAFAGYLVRIRFRESRVLPAYVSGYLNSPFGKRMLFVKARPSNNMSNISPTLLRRLPILVPPIAEQECYLELIREARATRERMLSAVEEATQLFSSLAQRVFGG